MAWAQEVIRVVIVAIKWATDLNTLPPVMHPTSEFVDNTGAVRTRLEVDVIALSSMLLGASLVSLTQDQTSEDAATHGLNRSLTS